MRIELPTLECLRCGHKWIPRNATPPKTCPGCNSPYWNKPKWKGVGRTPEWHVHVGKVTDGDYQQLERSVLNNDIAVKRNRLADGLDLAVAIARLSYQRLVNDLNELSHEYWLRRNTQERSMTQEVADTRRVSALSHAWQIIDSVYRLRRLVEATPGIEHDSQFNLFIRKTKDTKTLRDVHQHLHTAVPSELVTHGIPTWGRLSWMWKPEGSDSFVLFTLIPGQLFQAMHPLIDPRKKTFTVPIGLVTLDSTVQVCLSDIVTQEVARAVRLLKKNSIVDAEASPPAMILGMEIAFDDGVEE